MNIVDISKSLLDKDIFHRKYYSDWIMQASKSSNLIVLQGQRRVGKSFIVLDFLKMNNIPFKSIFYINKELDIHNEISDVKELDTVFKKYVDSNGEPKYIVLDEVQDIIEWEKFIRAKLASKNYTIIITGSNSNLLSSDLSTYLTGRYVTLHVYPFDFSEFASYNKLPLNNETLLYYIQNSGLPETFFIQQPDIKRNYIKNTMESIIFKDIVQRYSIRDSFLLEKIIGFMATSQGKLITINNITNYISEKYPKLDGISSNTIANYLSYLENAYVINKVKRYNIRGKKMLEIQDKYYFTDHGIKNIFGFDPKFDIGTILESIVFQKLCKSGYNVCVGQRDDKEIDFVASKGDETKYIQVTYLIGDNEKTFEREFGNLEKINDNYAKYVISCDPLASGNHNGIYWVSMLDFLSLTSF